MNTQCNYNFHTHTFRCGHASYESEEEYIDLYIKNNFKTIGFSDHMPFPKEELPQERIKMYVKDCKGYINKINSLKKVYNNIEILVGFECEYDRLYNHHLINLKEKCDYLILGQHFIRDVTPIGNIDYPIIYANSVCEALDTGLFDYLAHPDIFLKYRETIPKSNYDLYINNCKNAAIMICKKAKKLGIPLEINLSFKNNIKIMNDNHYPYPHPLFFDIAKKLNNFYVFGIDAHSKNVITKYNVSKTSIVNELKINNNIIYNYNPIKYRNSIINKKYKTFKNNKKEYIYEYIKYIHRIVKYNSNYKEVLKIVKDDIEKTHMLYNQNITKIKSEIVELSNTIMDINIKKKKIKRKELYIKYTKESYNYRLKILNNLYKKILNNKNKHRLTKALLDIYSKDR